MYNNKIKQNKIGDLMKKLLILIAALMMLPAILSATQMNVVGEVFTSTS